MSAETADLLETALKLPEKDRAELAAKLLSSLDGPSDSDARSSWLAEIERRVEELDSGTAKPIPWGELRSRLEKRVEGN